MKKTVVKKQPYFIAALTAACMIGFCGAAGAESVTEVSAEIKNQTVKAVVSGTVSDAVAGTPVGFYLEKDGKPACIEQGVIEEGGVYSFEFLANPEFGCGVFNYSIKARGADAQTGIVEIVDTEKLTSVLPKLAAVGSQAEMQELMSEIEPSVNMPVYEAIDKSEWYRILYNEISGKNVPSSASELYRLMKQCVVIAAVNGGADGIIRDGKLMYTDMLGLDAAIEAAYEGELSEKGIAAVNKHVTAEKYDRIKDCNDALEKLILTNRITHNVLSDVSVVQANLLSDGERLGLTLSRAKGREKEAARQLVLSGAETPADLLAAYNSICDSLKVVTGGGSGSGSGGSGGGSGSVFGGYQPSIQPTETGSAESAGFSDMEAYVWAQEAVAKLKAVGAVSGKSETEFAPADNVTREEFVKMILHAFGLMPEESESVKSQFSDVDSEQWYAPYVARAAGLGIAAGISDNEFGVGCPISRQDMAAISFRALRYKINSFDTDTEGLEFTDMNEIGEYARTPALLLKKLQVISGYPDGSFRPLQTASRAEAAQMIFSMLMLDE